MKQRSTSQVDNKSTVIVNKVNDFPVLTDDDKKFIRTAMYGDATDVRDFITNSKMHTRL